MYSAFRAKIQENVTFPHEEKAVYFRYMTNMFLKKIMFSVEVGQ